MIDGSTCKDRLIFVQPTASLIKFDPQPITVHLPHGQVSAAIRGLHDSGFVLQVGLFDNHDHFIARRLAKGSAKKTQSENCRRRPILDSSHDPSPS